MATARIVSFSRWRALLALLWRAGRARTTAFFALVLAAGLLPTAVILLTGSLIAAIPAATEQGAGPEGIRPALLALGALVGCLAALTLVGGALGHYSRILDNLFALEVHRAVARATLSTSGVAPLEEPGFADELHAVRDAERRGVLRRTVASLSGVVSTRIRGIGAFAVLLGFQWWAPLLLAAAWHLTNRTYLQATENGVSVNMSDGAVRLRRAEYLRSIVLEAPAAKEVRVFGLGGWVLGRYGEAWLDALGMLWRSRRANRGLTLATTLALAVSHAMVLGALGVAASRGEISVAVLLVFVQAVIATSDLGLLRDPQWFLAQSLAVAERVAGLTSRTPHAPDAERAPPAVVPAGKLAVHLAGVRFTYRGREDPILDGLTLEIPAGQSLAIVGENGAGKSTLVKLLCGLYDPDAGRITLGGGLSPRQARGRVAVIFQDFVRYALPLRENVAFGCLPLIGDQEALKGALEEAGGEGLLDRLPGGWDTTLARGFPGGVDLSGGQWQRVALARALAAVRGGAGLLILDEPTAALDVRSETELFERFMEVTRGITTLLVSHRLSSVRHADRIVVIAGGRVVEDGTHDELLRAGGRYAEMFSLQAERFASERLRGTEVGHA